MAEIKDWNADADQNTSAPPDGFPEGMARGALNNAMREVMAVLRRMWEAISGELLATSSDGTTYTLDPDQTYTSLATGIAFTFRVDHDCGADPTLDIGSLSANIKKVTESGLVNLEANDLLDKGVYTVVYVASEGWVLVAGGGGMPATIEEATLTDQVTIVWDAGANPRAKVTLAADRTVGAPTNATAGQRVTLRVIQDSVGSRALTWNSAFVWRSGSAPTLSTAANASDVFIFYYDGTSFVELASSIAPAGLTDSDIGDKAFSNPPSDLTNSEKTEARTAIEAAEDGGDIADDQLPDTITKNLQPGGSGFEVTKVTVSDSTPTLSDLQDGEVYFEY